MSDLYWITVLGSLSAVGIVFLSISIVVTVVSLIVFITTTINENEGAHKASSAMLKIFTPIFIISLLLTVFVPKTKELYIIYGVGGTIDYLKQNPTAQKLPEKYLKLLDSWADDKIKENAEKP